MGVTTATVTLSNPLEPGLRRSARLVVDTGSTYTWVSGETLGRLRVRPTRSARFRTIEGKAVEREIGPVVLRYDSLRLWDEVVFARRRDAEVLGVTTLERLGLRVNPVTRRLERAGLLAL